VSDLGFRDRYHGSLRVSRPIIRVKVRIRVRTTVRLGLVV